LIYDEKKRPSVDRYIQNRNEYYKMLQIKLTNPEIEIKEFKFDDCDICQSKNSLILTQNSLTKKQSVCCVNCNQRLANRTTILKTLIVNSKLDFDDDYVKYENWHNDLYDITYMLLIGKYKGKDFNRLNEQVRLLFP